MISGKYETILTEYRAASNQVDWQFVLRAPSQVGRSCKTRCVNFGPVSSSPAETSDLPLVGVQVDPVLFDFQFKFFQDKNNLSIPTYCCSNPLYMETSSELSLTRFSLVPKIIKKQNPVSF